MTTSLISAAMKKERKERMEVRPFLQAVPT